MNSWLICLAIAAGGCLFLVGYAAGWWGGFAARRDTSKDNT